MTGGVKTPPKATLMLIHFDDGSRLEARGEHAASCYEQIQSAEQWAQIHGWQFRGKPMEKIEGLIDKGCR